MSIRKLFSPLFWSVCLVFVKDLSTTLASGGADRTHHPGAKRPSKDTNPLNFVTNHFVLSNVISYMGWSPQIESRLREIRMMIPEIRAVIADSEPQMRDQLRFLLAEESGIEIVAECGDALQTITAVKTHKPDLLLLDIEMQDADGFQVLNYISSKDMPI